MPGPVSESGGGSSGSGEVDSEDADETGDEDAEESEDGEGAEEPVAPLKIDATINTVTPGGQCSAHGTIAVSGGQYPVTVHYQWRRLVIGGGWEGVPVSLVHNVSFTEPGHRDVQTDGLPEEGTNVFLVVTGPVEAGSGLVAYDGCSDGPGDITPGD